MPTDPFVTEPGTLAGVPPGGAAGAVLTKNSGNDGDSGWATAVTRTPAVTTPTLGAAAQLADKVHDADVYIDVTTAGNVVVAIGPTSGVATTIFSGTSPIQSIHVHLPAGWFIAVTTSDTGAWSATAITC
jgi:hypothetical protein